MLKKCLHQRPGLKLTRAALVLVGRVLDAHDFRDSALSAGAHEHVLRKRKTAKLAGVSLSFNLLWR